MHESEMKLKMRVRRIKEGRDLRGGFGSFTSCFSDVCENKPPCVPSLSLSQPCLPVANLGLTRVLPHLYVGSQKDVLDKELMARHDITYVLNASNTCPKPDFISENRFLRIPVNDSYCERLLPWLEKSNEFIDKAKVSDCKVIVHCLAGISRSATIVIAYIMKTMGLTSDDAYRFVKDRRPSISPNFNFLGQLLEFERDLMQKTPTCNPLRPATHQPDRVGQVSDQSDERRLSRQREQEALVVEMVQPASPTSIQRDFSSLRLSADRTVRSDRLRCSFHLDFKSVYSSSRQSQACTVPKLFNLNSPEDNRATRVCPPSEEPRGLSPSDTRESSIRTSEQEDGRRLEGLTPVALPLDLNPHKASARSSLFLAPSSIWTNHRGLVQGSPPATPPGEHPWFFGSDPDTSADPAETRRRRRSCQFEDGIVTAQCNEDFGKLRKQASFSGGMEVVEVS